MMLGRQSKTPEISDTCPYIRILLWAPISGLFARRVWKRCQVVNTSFPQLLRADRGTQTRGTQTEARAASPAQVIGLDDQSA